MCVDRGSIWYKVLVAWYGEVGGRLNEGGRYNSLWWKELVGVVCRGTGLGVGSWLDDNLQ